MATEVLDGSALKVFGAFQERPPLIGLNKLLFTAGPHVKQVIEITGEAGSGKSYIVLDILARCILPEAHQGSHVGGMNSGVVFMNADQHTDSFRLVRMMEVLLRRRLKDLNDKKAEEIISSSLKKLSILNIFSDEELLPALLSTRNLVFRDTDVSLVVLDSIAAHFWSNVAKGGIRKFDSYVDDVLKSFHQKLGYFKITFIYTRPSYFFSKTGLTSTLPTDFNLRLTNTRIVLKSRANVKRAEVHSGDNIHIVFYECSENGIEWSAG